VTYDVVFDAAHQTPEWRFTAVGLLFVVMGMVVRHVSRVPDVSPPPRALVPVRPAWLIKAWLGFAIFWTSLAVLLSVGDYLSMQRAIRNGRYRVAEGLVERFVSERQDQLEHFEVKGVPFTVASWEAKAGFHLTGRTGSPIRPGLPVKIHYVRRGNGNLIVLLAVRHDG
jgi:hypothetical protein